MASCRGVVFIPLHHGWQWQRIKVAILGGSGYTALELLKILLRHPAAEVVAVTSRQEGTPPVAELHPALAGRTGLRCEPLDPDRLHAGMKGYGLSVFKGTTPERFEVEVLGVLKNAFPKQDMDCPMPC